MARSLEPFYTALEINRLRSAAQFYELEAPVIFWTLVADELKYICNGAAMGF